MKPWNYFCVFVLLGVRLKNLPMAARLFSVVCKRPCWGLGFCKFGPLCRCTSGTPSWKSSAGKFKEQNGWVPPTPPKRVYKGHKILRSHLNQQRIEEMHWCIPFWEKDGRFWYLKPFCFTARKMNMNHENDSKQISSSTGFHPFALRHERLCGALELWGGVQRSGLWGGTSAHVGSLGREKEFPK